jgi:AcrR family transcriptional regulator
MFREAVNRAPSVVSTKTRILEAALDLFNAEGFGALSAVDVASALGISPGHLYYHFRGKAEIAAALARSYRDECDMVLDAARDACRGEAATLETLWTYVHILLEEAWDARFLYREAQALAAAHADIAADLRHILVRQRDTLRALLGELAGRRVIAAGPEVLDGVARLMTTAVGYHALLLELEGDAGPPRERVARAAAQIMLLPAGLIGTGPAGSD